MSLCAASRQISAKRGDLTKIANFEVCQYITSSAANFIGNPIKLRWGVKPIFRRRIHNKGKGRCFTASGVLI